MPRGDSKAGHPGVTPTHPTDGKGARRLAVADHALNGAAHLFPLPGNGGFLVTMHGAVGTSRGNGSWRRGGRNGSGIRTPAPVSGAASGAVRRRMAIGVCRRPGRFRRRFWLGRLPVSHSEGLHVADPHQLLSLTCTPRLLPLPASTAASLPAVWCSRRLNAQDGPVRTHRDAGHLGGTSGSTPPRQSSEATPCQAQGP